MPRITRKQQKVFAVDASNNGVFGSLQAQDPVHSQDPDVIQSRTAYSNGWNDATYSAEKLPPLEEFQSLQYLFSRQIAYLMQDGISEWNSATTYYKGSLVKAIQNDGSFILYASLVDNNTNNQVTDTTKWVITNTSTNFHQGVPNWRADVVYSEGDWVKATSGSGYAIFESLSNNNLNNAVTNGSYWAIKPFATNPLFYSNWFDYQVGDASWLRADTFAWNDGTVYKSAYNHLADDIDGITPTTETIGSYTITYYPATDGHKIVLPDQEATVLNIYNESGVAWYYVLDTANTRFKLPRENPDREKLVQIVKVKGNGVALGISDGTTDLGLKQGGAGGSLYASTTAVDESIGTTTVTGGTTTAQVALGLNENPDKSNVVADMTDSTSVYKGKKYLYFYVGNEVRNQTEIDVGQITNALSQKLDSDRIQFVQYLPADPVANVIYLIEE